MKHLIDGRGLCVHLKDIKPRESMVDETFSPQARCEECDKFWIWIDEQKGWSEVKPHLAN